MVFFINKLKCFAISKFSFYRVVPSRISVDEEFADKSNKQIFSDIYRDKKWGGDENSIFYSGSGSHVDEIVNTYVGAVRDFFPQSNQMIAVDIGCGDFNVGCRLYSMFSNYIACDIVEDLINFNNSRFQNKNLSFRCLDVVEDELPAGDIVFVRQVFQHLSNDDILKVIRKIEKKYNYAVITEHVPVGHFPANLDKPSGPNIRLILESGIVLHEPPFSLRHKSLDSICEINEYGGVIRTIVYKLG